MSDERLGGFTEDLEYTVHGKPLSHPVWVPKKPDPKWVITAYDNYENAMASHPDYPDVIFRWNPRNDTIEGKIRWHGGPIYVETVWHICSVPKLFCEFMTAMMEVATTPIHKFPNDKIIVL